MLAAWQQGDTHAFEILYKRYVLELMDTACRKTSNHDLAYELVQDSFLHVYERRDTLAIHTSFRAYLYATLKHTILNHYRHQYVCKKYEQYLQEKGVSVEDDAGMSLEGKELADKLHRQIEKLPVQCRTVFLLSREEQLSHKEIAERLHISINTVEQHIRKALRQLRLAVSDYELMMILLAMMPCFK